MGHPESGQRRDRGDRPGAWLPHAWGVTQERQRAKQVPLATPVHPDEEVQGPEVEIDLANAPEVREAEVGDHGVALVGPRTSMAGSHTRGEAGATRQSRIIVARMRLAPALGDRLAALEPRRRVGLWLGPLVFAALGLGLPATGMAAPAAWAAATVVLMATWWITESLPLWATALLPVPLFPALSGVPLGETLLQYLDPVNFLFLGGMWIAAAMEQWGLHRRLALGIVARVGTSPRRIVLGFMLATGFVSLWISNTAAALMMFPIGMAVLQKFDEAATAAADPVEALARLRAFGCALMLGIGYAASMAGVGSKIGTGTNLVFVREAQRTLGWDISFVSWFKLGLPVMALSIPLSWLYLVRVAARVPADEFPGGRAAIFEARSRLGTMSRGEGVALFAFLLAASLWVFRQPMDFGAFILPGWSAHVPWTWERLLGRPTASLPPPLAELLGPRGAESAIAMLIGTALLAAPVSVRPYRPALALRQAGGISWGLLALLGGGFAMANAISRSGLSKVLGGLFTHLHTGSPYLTVVVLCLGTVAISEVASNTATASILLPLLAAGAEGLGLAPGPLMFAVTLSASFGFMLPAGTPPNAVVFSSGYIPVVRMAKSGLVVDIAGAILIATVCHLLGPWALGGR
jgi:sodium-dependent dicarboxylate transporter 2/3/5